jgi:uncharacterized protein (DUF342 family)
MIIGSIKNPLKGLRGLSRVTISRSGKLFISLRALPFRKFCLCYAENRRRGRLEAMMPFSGSDRDGAILVHISEDEMLAVVDLYPHVGKGKPLDLDSVEYAMLNAGVTNGIDREALVEGIRNTEGKDEPLKGVAAARGTPAVNTTPLHFELSFHAESAHAKAQEKVDYRESSAIPIVHKNDVLARPVARVEGRRGITVTGRELPFSDAADERLEAGDNVAVLGNGQYVARDDGRLIAEKGRIRIESALIVEKDVDFSTGNIRFPKDVVVNGNVLDDFVVETNGNLSVKGLVSAASLYAKGAIEILGGFSGKGRGAVRGDGEVHVAYVDNGLLVCKGNLVVANEIVNSSVFSNGKITCVGKKGTIIGGSVSARGGIECSTAGAERSHATRLEVGVDVLAASRLKKTEALIARLSERISAVAFALEDASRKGKSSPGLDKERKELVGKLNEVVLVREKLKEVLYFPEAALVRVHARVFPGVVISICGVEKPITETMGPTTFALDAGSGHIVTDKQPKGSHPADGRGAGERKPAPPAHEQGGGGEPRRGKRKGDG